MSGHGTQSCLEACKAIPLPNLAKSFLTGLFCREGKDLSGFVQGSFVGETRVLGIERHEEQGTSVLCIEKSMQSLTDEVSELRR